jgi:hypothetical protein
MEPTPGENLLRLSVFGKGTSFTLTSYSLTDPPVPKDARLLDKVLARLSLSRGHGFRFGRSATACVRELAGSSAVSSRRARTAAAPRPWSGGKRFPILVIFGKNS